MDCAASGFSGYAISGDLNMLETLVMKSDARYIIVVEKVFTFVFAIVFGQHREHLSNSRAAYL